MRAAQAKEFAALGMVGVVICVLSWLALGGDNDAKIALIGVLTAGTGWAMRGKVEAQQ